MTKDKIELLKGCIKEMINMGAIYYKMDDFDILFKITPTSELNDIEKLRKAKNIFLTNFALTLKVYYIK